MTFILKGLNNCCICIGLTHHVLIYAASGDVHSWTEMPFSRQTFRYGFGTGQWDRRKLRWNLRGAFSFLSFLTSMFFCLAPRFTRSYCCYSVYMCNEDWKWRKILSAWDAHENWDHKTPLHHGRNCNSSPSFSIGCGHVFKIQTRHHR